MSQEEDRDEGLKQELMRTERRRNPDLRAQQIAELWAECGDWIEAVQKEGLERGVELSRASARAKASVFRRRLANSPYWEEMLRQLPPGDSARRNIETLLRAETEANVAYQGKDTGLPDHRTRLQSVRQQQELRRGMDRMELGFHELDLGHDRLEIERERNEVIGQIGSSPVAQIVLQAPNGRKQVIDAQYSVRGGNPALPDVMEAEGRAVDEPEGDGWVQVTPRTGKSERRGRGIAYA